MSNKSFLPVLIVILIFASGLSAQSSKSDVCFVGLMDYSRKDPERQEFILSRRLGTFKPVVGEEERTTHAFRLPHTKLFVVASVFFTDESMQVGEYYDSISLQILVSTRKKHDPIHSLRYAEAEQIYRTPYVARVYTPFTIRPDKTNFDGMPSRRTRPILRNIALLLVESSRLQIYRALTGFIAGDVEQLVGFLSTVIA
jgi:hypothetical protein